MISDLVWDLIKGLARLRPQNTEISQISKFQKSEIQESWNQKSWIYWQHLYALYVQWTFVHCNNPIAVPALYCYSLIFQKSAGAAGTYNTGLYYACSRLCCL